MKKTHTIKNVMIVISRIVSVQVDGAELTVYIDDGDGGYHEFDMGDNASAMRAMLEIYNALES